jgi:2-keto-4-pentenoate hydratase/2-oxohepta-3-ene-1,7-dioic acid hydratase in catechol pathway
MRLVRFRNGRDVRPGLLDGEGGIRDLSGVVPDLAGAALLSNGLAELELLDPEALPRAPRDVRLAAPIGGIGKIIGVGLNYRDHAQECGLALPTEPTLFLKATSALSGPDDPVVMPRDAKSLDWEVELGVIIGAGGVYIEEAEALDRVAGYCLGVDFSERDFQFNRGGQGFKGKSADTFAPLGPWFVTRGAVPDPQDLALRLEVDGVVRQEGTTADMIFSVAYLVAYVSRFMSLQPGDVILTGTPAGVGMGGKPPAYLEAGQEVVASAEPLGRQAHRVVAAQ